MGAKAEVLALLLVFMARLCDCQVALVAEREVMTEPGLSLRKFTSFICQATPGNVTVAIRWILPSGSIFTQGVTGRFLVNQVGPSGGILFVTLLINQLSYRDAGVYTCEVMDRDPAIPDASWISATIELQLNVNLQALENEVNATNTDSEATLRCEMSDFIREDEDLQWFRGGQQITNSSRHTVTYENGTPEAAQNGGKLLVPARVSVLTIPDPVVADSGMYTCQIQGTTESANVQLSVVEAPPPTPAPSPSPPTSAAGSSTPTWMAAPIVVGVLLAIATGTLVGIVIYRQKRIRKFSPSAHDLRHPNPMYEDVNMASLDGATDIDLKDNIAYGPATPQQPVIVYGEVASQTNHRNIEMIENVAYGQTSH